MPPVVSIQTDLANASKVLKIDQVGGSNYPSAWNQVDSGKSLIASTVNSFADYQE